VSLGGCGGGTPASSVGLLVWVALRSRILPLSVVQ
jgi:uncharacterized protein (TIGR03382 family)